MSQQREKVERERKRERENEREKNRKRVALTCVRPQETKKSPKKPIKEKRSSVASGKYKQCKL